jgi:hypothetical protein
MLGASSALAVPVDDLLLSDLIRSSAVHDTAIVFAFPFPISHVANPIFIRDVCTSSFSQ